MCSSTYLCFHEKNNCIARKISVAGPLIFLKAYLPEIRVQFQKKVLVFTTCKKVNRIYQDLVHIYIFLL